MIHLSIMYDINYSYKLYLGNMYLITIMNICKTSKKTIVEKIKIIAVHVTLNLQWTREYLKLSQETDLSISERIIT